MSSPCTPNKTAGRGQWNWQPGADERHSACAPRLPHRSSQRRSNMPDEPIIVTGGSVTIDFGNTLQSQTNGPTGMQRYSIEAGSLVSLQINRDEPVVLSKEDVITTGSSRLI